MWTSGVDVGVPVSMTLRVILEGLWSGWAGDRDALGSKRRNPQGQSCLASPVEKGLWERAKIFLGR
jgi:hypothetical protein